MDSQFRTFKKRQFFANALILVGAVGLFSGSVNFQIFGGVLMAGGFCFLMFQRFFQKDLYRKDMQFKKEIANEIKLERQNESKTERDVRKIKFILMCMSAAIGFFILAMTYSLFMNS